MAEDKGDWVQRVERATEGTIHQQLVDLVGTARESLSELSGQGRLIREAVDRLTGAVESARAEQKAAESRRESGAAGVPSQIDAVREAVAAVPREVAVLRDSVAAFSGRIEERVREARAETVELVASLRNQMNDVRRAVEQMREEDRRAAAEREQALARRLEEMAAKLEAVHAAPNGGATQARVPAVTEPELLRLPTHGGHAFE